MAKKKEFDSGVTTKEFDSGQFMLDECVQQHHLYDLSVRHEPEEHIRSAAEVAKSIAMVGIELHQRIEKEFPKEQNEEGNKIVHEEIMGTFKTLAELEITKEDISEGRQHVDQKIAKIGIGHALVSGMATSASLFHYGHDD